jgi:hypothetical protein
LVATVAVAGFLIWVAPPIVGVPVLMAAVLLIPAPLAVLLRHGGRNAQVFALGSLASYAAWLVISGLPCGGILAYRFMHVGRLSPGDFEWEVGNILLNRYTAYVGLYAPWIVVPLTGAVALAIYQMMQE